MSSGDSFVPHTLSGSNEWNTPASLLRLVHQVVGEITLDPASNARANKTVKARCYYTIEQDGLQQDWTCESMFLNPPYGRTGGVSNQEIWSCRLIADHTSGKVKQAILLVNASTGTNWFQRLATSYPVCLVQGRIRFVGNTGQSDLGPTHDNAFFYFGGDFDLFDEVFSSLGIVYPARKKQVSTLWDEEIA
jgi:phage N-6-adenine-methyltransferase